VRSSQGQDFLELTKGEGVMSGQTACFDGEDNDAGDEKLLTYEDFR
jgi:hypothetical protein